MGGSEKGCDWQLGVMVNKIVISIPKISSINYIDIPPNPTSTNMIKIADSDPNIHISRQYTTTMAPIIMEIEWKQDYQMEALWSPHL